MASASDETSQLLQVFPTEVWEKIFKNVIHSKDFQNIGSASPHFYNLLRSLATQILFSEVIQIVINHKNDAYFYHNRPWMGARKVCRAWRDGLDQELQTQQYFRQQENKLMFETRGMTFDDNCFSDFKTAQYFVRFKEHFEFDPSYNAGNKNPFPSRKVYLIFKEDEEGYNLEQYYTACLHFLEKFGAHIWYCIVRQKLQLRNSVNLATFFSQWLYKILGLMPNLRGFEIDGRQFPSSIERWLEIPDDGFPTLPRLEYLSLRGMPFPISQRLILSNPQLQRIDSSEDIEPVPFCLQFLSQLKHIGMTVRRNRDFEVLLSCEFVSHVEYLWLNMSAQWVISLYNIFRLLKTHFSQSLTELHLSLPRAGREEMNCALELPLVKKLHLEVKYPVPIGILLELRETLNELHLTLPDGLPARRSDSDDRDEPEEEGTFFIKLYNCLTEPEKCNIWEYFPKLRFLQIRTLSPGENAACYSATRSQWERLIK